MKNYLSPTEKVHVTLAKSESNEAHKDEVIVDGDAHEKWSMPKSTCAPKHNYEKKFDSICNKKRRTMFNYFT